MTVITLGDTDPALAGFILSFDPDSVRVEETDNRRKKEYRLDIGWAVMVFGAAPVTGWENRASALRGPLFSNLPGQPATEYYTDWYKPPAEVLAAVPESQRYGRDRTLVRGVAVRANWSVGFTKPSDMPKDNHPAALKAMEIRFGFSCRDDWQSLVLEKLKEHLRTGVGQIAAEARAEQAGWLARQLGRDADKRAREVVRFEQRLAGLVAELEAEQKAQGKLVVEELRKDPTIADGEGPDAKAETLDPRVIEAAIKHMVYPPGLGDRFGSSESVKVPLEEVA